MLPLRVSSPFALALVPTYALAIPGPDTTAVLANGNLPEGGALARSYLEARSIPKRQLCLLDLPQAETIAYDDYLHRIDRPFAACLSDAGVEARIEAVVLTRGVPLRVTMPDRGEGAQRASLAAVLGASRSVLEADGSRLIERAPGFRAMCGSTPCLAAAWRNPYRRGRFDSGWSGRAQGVLHRPWLVTMLHGRSYLDAARLIASATTAEQLADAGERNRTFMLMAAADPARGVLDQEHENVANQLIDRGFEVLRVPFSPARSGERLAAFVTGAASLGETIEGSELSPGAVVDNVTSFGAVPENFRETGEERQVSIARWVARGVAGVHGTTDEPLNNCFPSRAFLVDWADGLTLAEAYHRNLPFLYWRNLVLGDPMAAPWARRPRVELDEVDPGAIIEGSTWLTVRAEPAPHVTRLVVYIDGREIDRVEGPGASMLRVCAPVPVGGRIEVLAVAEAAEPARGPSKGWRVLEVEGRPGPGDCGRERPDAGRPETGSTMSDAEVIPADASFRWDGSVPSSDSGEGPSADSGGLSHPIGRKDERGGCRCGPMDPRRPGPIPFAVLILAIYALSPRPKRSRSRKIQLQTQSDPNRSPAPRRGTEGRRVAGVALHALAKACAYSARPLNRPSRSSGHEAPCQARGKRLACARG